MYIYVPNHMFRLWGRLRTGIAHSIFLTFGHAMIVEFESYLRSHANFSVDDLKRICSLAEPKTLHRNDFLLLEGEICRHKTFIVKGMLRVFGTRADGSEHILLFSPEHTWTLDAESYDTQTPSRCHIAAVKKLRIILRGLHILLLWIARHPANRLKIR